MRYQVTVEPTFEPVSVAEAKLHCRVDVDDDDALITRAIVEGRQVVENILEMSACDKTIVLWLDGEDVECLAKRPTAPLEIDRTPIRSVTSFEYVDSAGVLQTWDASNYDVDVADWPARISPKYGVSWPVCRDQLNCCKVTMEAGFADAASVPAFVKNAVLRYVGWVYQNREERADGSEFVQALERELHIHRRKRIVV